jgi:catalase
MTGVDFHRKDLNEAIENGYPAKWKFAIQTIPEANEHDFEFDILDDTKVWPEELVPLEVIGEFVLDRVVDEFFTETEQVAFCTRYALDNTPSLRSYLAYFHSTQATLSRE